jgi:hypothetical protein
VYSGEINGQILTISASGWTYDRTFVLYDYETESLWYHMPGEDGLICIRGFYAGQKLEEFMSTQTRWRDWFAENPNTKFLKYSDISR